MRDCRVRSKTVLSENRKVRMEEAAARNIALFKEGKVRSLSSAARSTIRILTKSDGKQHTPKQLAKQAGVSEPYAACYLRVWQRTNHSDGAATLGSEVKEPEFEPSIRAWAMEAEGRARALDELEDRLSAAAQRRLVCKEDLSALERRVDALLERMANLEAFVLNSKNR